MTQQTQISSPLLTFKEAMAYLRVSRSTLYRLMWSGQVVGHKVGSTWRFYASDLTASIQAVASLSPTPAAASSGDAEKALVQEDTQPEWTPPQWLAEALIQYQQGMREAHVQGMLELLGSKNTVERVELPSGRSALVAYDRERTAEKEPLG